MGVGVGVALGVGHSLQLIRTGGGATAAGTLFHAGLACFACPAPEGSGTTPQGKHQVSLIGLWQHAPLLSSSTLVSLLLGPSGSTTVLPFEEGANPTDAGALDGGPSTTLLPLGGSELASSSIFRPGGGGKPALLLQRQGTEDDAPLSVCSLNQRVPITFLLLQQVQGESYYESCSF